ncbi:hypothetical protein W97_04924 [Coniosporium apollinis CBS 100218]|uniref:RING-type E3 ubiquitin transferase n=1 Tax=Coniosporium apollinis (strain CBS 100218) TaxID=1168221 RepID=R7YUT9_CONA1|nr:uncharacterized protein W97_04924 [Coniosporium apollinis CBS 100218]EON65685.1 hypothetical protein W97_04924 [Coniosporium apollinis CBS 100218]
MASDHPSSPPAGPSTEPDIMNDPAYDPNKPSAKAPDEPDVCRVCRGEGTEEEPLFYPCKCSGSIKFVHQDCLMQWLSHSQKKHCELCKTPFRFTKLYHPHMPSSLPTTVFLRRALIHMFGHIAAWSRGLLVVAVWLLWLPWCMRIVWRSLFWLGDAGWVRDVRAAQVASGQPLSELLAPESPMSLNLSSNITGLPSLRSFLRPYSQTLNMSAGEPTAFTFVKQFFIGYPQWLNHYGSDLGSIDANSTTGALLARKHSSLLSEISFFSSISSSPLLNRLILDVLEGQIITLFVVVAFILIFLIREWVVQQQPAINLAALNAGDAPQVAEAPAEPIPAEGDNHGVAAQAENEGDEAQSQAESGGVEQGQQPTDSSEARPGTVNTASDGSQQPSGRDDAAPAASASGMQPEDRDNVVSVELMKLMHALPPDLRDAIRQGLTDSQLADIVDRGGPEERVWFDGVKRIMTARGLAPSESELSQLAKEGPSVPAGSNTTAPVVGDGQDHIAEQQRTRVESPSRPSMPTREKSFLATGIQRGLEEDTLSSGVGNSLPETVEVDRNSEGSWQDVSQSDDDSDDEEVNRTSDEVKNKGKGKADVAQAMKYGSVSELLEASARNATSYAGLYSDSDGSSDELNGREHTPELREHRMTVHTEDSSSSPTQRSVEAQHASHGGLDDGNRDTAADSSAHPTHDSTLPSPTPLDSVPAATQEQELRADEVMHMQQNPTQQPHVPHPGFLDQLLDWLWGDVAPGEDEDARLAPNDEHIVQDIADEAPFVALERPAALDGAADFADGPAQDPEVAAAAAQAGIDINDQDAIEDAEDLEGILELIGMQGPILGLFQNAMFSAVLISVSVAGAVWLPYMLGKAALIVLGNPAVVVKLPLQVISASADFILDVCLFSAAALSYGLTLALRPLAPHLTHLMSLFSEGTSIDTIAESLKTAAETAFLRTFRTINAASASLSLDLLELSLKSHTALRAVQSQASYGMELVVQTALFFFRNLDACTPQHVVREFLVRIPQAIQAVNAFVFSMMFELGYMLGPLKALKSLSPQRAIVLAAKERITLDPSLGFWSATDRSFAVFAGYTSIALAGAGYLRLGRPITNSQQGRKIEDILSDILQQAGGVLKVILIISIEMLAFPLYCGLLLDAALLPVFENASFISRFEFTMRSPWTSAFVHWFVGTCYMFHFALFVTMCRKIMRRGVLYFIRDPDDPTFHPVRDVLERSVVSQLRKIAFSALVYGALVIVCLGGVVWSLHYAASSVLPIHWVSNDPALEFPLDLLFFNFLTPLVIKIFKPADGLNTMYEWWFRKCARILRLSQFLFGERQPDEEGHHVRRTWSTWLQGKQGNVDEPVIGEDRKLLADDREQEVYFLWDGRYVRAPASDQVRIPKGEPVFVEVDANNRRKDGKDEYSGVHARKSDMTTMIYVPPWFRARIALFVLTIWAFAAATGVGCTIVPLLFGRAILSYLVPPSVRINDIYAYSVGSYILGSIAYITTRHRTLLTHLTALTGRPTTSARLTLTLVATGTSRALRILYVYTTLLVLLPLAFALLLEFYLLIPLHAYLAPNQTHIIHLIQDWTLGFLYARIAARILLFDRTSRPARALRAVVRDGYLNPDARLATRGFVLPLCLLFTAAICSPWLLATALNKSYFAAADQEARKRLYRMAYPALLALAVGAWAVWGLVRATARWRARIRDEVYLIGERLHNFGERKPPPGAAVLRRGGEGGVVVRGL